VSDLLSPDPEIKGKVKVQGTGRLDFVLVNLSSFKRHLLVTLSFIQRGRMRSIITDICSPIYDTGNSGGLLGFEGRKSRGLYFGNGFFMLAEMI
jgi:hypothetical protein